MLDLLKSGKVRLRRTIDQGNLIKLLGEWCNKFVFITEKLFSTEIRNPKGTEGYFVIDQGNLIVLTSKKRQIPQTFAMGSDAAEFVNKIKDQVRNRQKRMTNVADSGEEHSIIWGMFMTATMNAATFMGKNFQDNQNSMMNTSDLTLKKMFDISAKLVSEQDEIFKVDTMLWEKHSWKYLSLIDDETIINLQRAKVYVFSDSVLCLGRVHQYPMSNEAWKERIGWIITDKSLRDYDGISGEPTEFEWNIFPGFTTLQLCSKVTDLLSRLGETPATVTGRILFMSMFNNISCDKKNNEEECVANAKVVSIFAKKFGKGQWSFVCRGSEKK